MEIHSPLKRTKNRKYSQTIKILFFVPLPTSAWWVSTVNLTPSRSHISLTLANQQENGNLSTHPLLACWLPSLPSRPYSSRCPEVQLVCMSSNKEGATATVTIDFLLVINLSWRGGGHLFKYFLTAAEWLPFVLLHHIIILSGNYRRNITGQLMHFLCFNCKYAPSHSLGLLSKQNTDNTPPNDGQFVLSEGEEEEEWWGSQVGGRRRNRIPGVDWQINRINWLSSTLLLLLLLSVVVSHHVIVCRFVCT